MKTCLCRGTGVSPVSSMGETPMLRFTYTSYENRTSRASKTGPSAQQSL